MPEVPIYYLQDNPDAQPRQFTSTFYIYYTNKKGVLQTGPVGFTAAMKRRLLPEVAYNCQVTPAADGVLAQALSDHNDYYLAAEIQHQRRVRPRRLLHLGQGAPRRRRRVFAHAKPEVSGLGTKLRELAP